MRMVDVIDHKRNGGVLTNEEIKFFVDGVVDGSIPDYQTSALLMAIYFNGMADGEQAELAMQRLKSGDQLDLSDIRELVSLLRRTSNSLNQLTKRVHETGNIYSDDIEELRKSYDKLWETADEILCRLSTI